MIIVDSSIWADSYRSGVPQLARILGRGEVLQHPFITGELALGNPRDRRALIAMLDALPQAPMAEHDDLLRMVIEQALGGTGIGYVDAHLLASARTANAALWTRDKRLMKQAERLGLLHTPG